MVEKDWTAWGHLARRYRSPSPRRMLALDGGGIRGLLTLQVLVEIEKQIKNHYGRGEAFRLSEFFDYVGGTSTGAIVAAGIARGLTAQELLDFYRSFGKVAFSKRPWYERWKSLYQDERLQEKLKDVYGAEATLEPQHLKTLLLVVTRNATTDSAWPISSNPSAKYNALDRKDCNLKIPLWRIVRASTAAPVFFPPEVIPWDPADPSKAFVFVDGGTTPYNNPALLMARMATEPAYRLRWEQGESKLLIVSVGTGLAPVLGKGADDPESNLVSGALNTLQALMSQAQFDQDVGCRTIGRCTFGHFLDREIEDLIPRTDSKQPFPLSVDLRRAFLYVRYNLDLTEKGLGELGLPEISPGAVSRLDATDQMDNLERIGQALAQHVSLAHLGPFLKVPLHGLEV